MKAIELLQKNPESSKLICSYYLEIMLESLNDDNLPEDFKAHVREQGIDEDKIAAILDGNPRNLFDFFDSQSLFINIMTEKGETFSYKIIINEIGVSSTLMAKTRKEAEKEAIIAAIGMLETRLTNSIIDKENS
jgi:CO dehydrogenase/acetyl-CoA synthase gamma subunit (corrinoid Fe-S protein)